MSSRDIVTNNTRGRYPELYQFFAGYFYQGWAADYRWDGTEPSFEAVVRHFRAVNPPSVVNSVRDQLTQLINSARNRAELVHVLSELGNGFNAGFEGLGEIEWLEQIVDVLSESASTAMVLRERS